MGAQIGLISCPMLSSPKGTKQDFDSAGSDSNTQAEKLSVLPLFLPRLSPQAFVLNTLLPSGLSNLYPFRRPCAFCCTPECWTLSCYILFAHPCPSPPQFSKPSSHLPLSLKQSGVAILISLKIDRETAA